MKEIQLKKQRKNGYRICQRCVMDTSDYEIYFDDNGFCNHCISYFKRIPNQSKQNESTLNALISRIKEEGKNKKYDCIIGLSGGVDSSFLAYKVIQLGLRPLAVHFDNGWDSELAVKNIENIVNKLKIDLHTFVMDWEEFRHLQLSFLKASVPDCEIPTDHGIIAVLYETALKERVRYIISGTNTSTEGILPNNWSYGATDWRYIKSVHKNYSGTKLRAFPRFGFIKWCYLVFVRRKIRVISLLDFVQYNKKSAMNIIENELDWKYYGCKHGESIYTQFYQTYILPVKFKIDKRRAHLSTLICSGQITRKEALKELEEPTYQEKETREKMEYVLKKLKLTQQEFNNILALPTRTYKEFSNQVFQRKILNFFIRLVKYF